MNQGTAGTLNQYPNLIELIGRHSELLGTAVWREPAIGSDDPSIGSDDTTIIASDDAGRGFNPLLAAHDNILQDDVNGPLIAVSLTGHEAIGQDDIRLLGHDAIGQDDIRLLGHDAIGQDDLILPPMNLDRISICSDDDVIGQDDISGIAQVG